MFFSYLLGVNTSLSALCLLDLLSSILIYQKYVHSDKLIIYLQWVIDSDLVYLQVDTTSFGHFSECVIKMATE
jgi:hypothetical protein